MTQSFPVSGRDRARANQIFGADDLIAGWLRAGFLNRLIGRAPGQAHRAADAHVKAHVRTAGDAEASWTVCLDRGADLPRRRLSILSDQGAAPLMRIEGFRAENFYATPARAQLR